MRTSIINISCSIKPCCNPITVTFMDTSLLGTKPHPTIRESFPDIPKKFAGIPQPTIFVIIA
jgi:hypothetical protein